MASLPPPPPTHAALAAALATLFEPSPLLFERLVPELAAAPPAATYAELAARGAAAVAAWDAAAQAAFVAAHPRIGQIGGLSALSAQEQAARAAPPGVLADLAALNARYEARFRGLRYVTFVAGRTRAEVRDELARVLGEEEDGADDAAWAAELARAVRDVGRIAASRAQALGAL